MNTSRRPSFFLCPVISLTLAFSLGATVTGSVVGSLVLISSAISVVGTVVVGVGVVGVVVGFLVVVAMVGTGPHWITSASWA